jgi:hypothetical protein
MKRKRNFVAVCLIVTFVGSYVFAARSEAVKNFLGFEIAPREIFQKLQFTSAPSPVEQKNASTSPAEDNNANKPKSAEIPDRITYWFLFKKADTLEKAARKAQAENRNAAEYREFFKGKLNLTEAQNNALMEIAATCVMEIETLDAEAQEIIKKGHEELKRNPPRPGDAPPAPPAELAQLQIRRESAINRFREMLRQSLGDDKFAEIDLYVKKEIAPKVSNDFKKGARSEKFPPIRTTRPQASQSEEPFNPVQGGQKK